MMVEKWYRHGYPRLYTRQQVRDLIGTTKLSDGLTMLYVNPYVGKGNSFSMERVMVPKGTKEYTPTDMHTGFKYGSML